MTRTCPAAALLACLGLGSVQIGTAGTRGRLESRFLAATYALFPTVTASAQEIETAACPPGQRLHEERYDSARVTARGCTGRNAEGEVRRWGRWAFFDRAGQKVAEGSYESGEVSVLDPLAFHNEMDCDPIRGLGVPSGGREGTWTFWYRNGQKCFEGRFRTGKPEGTAVGWFANGQKSREVTYRAGEAQGLWVYWHENGQKREEGNYEANKREGKWVSWYANGQKQEEGRYRSNVREGRWVSWHPNGQTNEEGVYRAGSRIGQWSATQESGEKDEQRSGTYWDAQQPIPLSIVAFEQQLKRRLLDTLDLAAELRGSCEEIAFALRGEPTVAEDIGITPAFIAPARDDELCRLAITRWVVGLEWMVAGLSALSFASLDAMDDPTADQEIQDTYSRLLKRFYPERTLPAPLDTDGREFLEWFYPPIRAREDAARYDEIQKGYRPLASHGVAWKTDALTQNERYLERNSGSERRLQRVPAFWDEPWTKWPFGPLYSSDFLTQRLIIEERDGQPKLVFVVWVSNRALWS